MTSDYFDHVERELRTAVRAHAHLPWYVRLRLRHSRVLVVVLVGLIVAGPALAAAGLFQGGSPVAPVVAPTRTAGDGVAISSSVTLLALRTPDPPDGLPWGMRVLRTTRGLVCVQVGRVDFGTVGALGRDGAFGNDGRFHSFSENFEQGPPCATPDAHGDAYLNVAQYGISASALLAGPRGPRCRAPRSLVGVPPRFRAPTSRELREVRGPFCPIAELRDVYYGLLGPDAVSVTHQTPSGGLVTTPTTGPDGAYLIVLPNHPTINNGGLSYNAALFPGAVRAVTYRDGQTCRLPAPTVPGKGGASCPTVGYISPTGLLPTPAEVAARVTARLEIAKHYCVNGRLTEPCPTRIPRGFTRLNMRSPRGEVVAPEGLLVVSFTARVAVTNGHSYYYIQTCDPPNAHSQIPRWFQRLSRKNFECFYGGSEAPTSVDYKAGARVTQSQFVSLQPRGVIHGDVSLVITTGPTAPTPSPATKGQSIGRDVGHFALQAP